MVSPRLLVLVWSAVLSRLVSPVALRPHGGGRCPQHHLSRQSLAPGFGPGFGCRHLGWSASLFLILQVSSSDAELPQLRKERVKTSENGKWQAIASAETGAPSPLPIAPIVRDIPGRCGPSEGADGGKREGARETGDRRKRQWESARRAVMGKRGCDCGAWWSTLP